MPTNIEDVIQELAEFDYVEEAKDTIKRKHAAQAKLADIWEKDAEWKLEARKKYAPVLLGFLLLQNFAFLWFIALAYSENKLGDFQPFMGTVILGTFVETAYLVKIIVRWVFTDINYPQHPFNKK